MILPALCVISLVMGQSTQGCSSNSEGGSVVSVLDGENDRCFSLITPPSAKKPMPILMWFHGAG
jgi:poly(3-hydroxybutyrate) depolymerase